MYLQNPNGVMCKDKSYNDQRTILSLWEWGVDIISLPETNRNWAKEWLQNRWKSEVQRVWRHAKVFSASIDQPTERRADFVQGGACLIVTGKWASRVMAYGSDYLGRWVWVTLRGRWNQKLTVVSMYRPNPVSKSSGPTTVWSQQRSRLQ